MTLIDGVIIGVIIVFLALILKSGIKHRKRPCKMCAYAKSCDVETCTKVEEIKSLFSQKK